MILKQKIHSPIEIRIKYSLSDYYSAVADHSPQVLRDSGKSGPEWLIRLIAPLAACAASFFNNKLKPVYRFTFSIDGITRESDSSKMVKTWSEIVRVQDYSHCFMIELEKGAMPIPFRFLTEDQQKILRAAFIG